MDIWPVFYQLYLEANRAQVTISSSAKCATTPERDLSLRSISQLLYRLALLTLGTLAAPPPKFPLAKHVDNSTARRVGEWKLPNIAGARLADVASHC
jgi:hypothetical protein